MLGIIHLPGPAVAAKRPSHGRVARWIIRLRIVLSVDLPDDRLFMYPMRKCLGRLSTHRVSARTAHDQVSCMGQTMVRIPPTYKNGLEVQKQLFLGVFAVFRESLGFGPYSAYH